MRCTVHWWASRRQPMTVGLLEGGQGQAAFLPSSPMYTPIGAPPRLNLVVVTRRCSNHRSPPAGAARLATAGTKECGDAFQPMDRETILRELAQIEDRVGRTQRQQPPIASISPA